MRGQFSYRSELARFLGGTCRKCTRRFRCIFSVFDWIRAASCRGGWLIFRMPPIFTTVLKYPNIQPGKDNSILSKAFPDLSARVSLRPRRKGSGSQIWKIVSSSLKSWELEKNWKGRKSERITKIYRKKILQIANQRVNSLKYPSMIGINRLRWF